MLSVLYKTYLLSLHEWFMETTALNQLLYFINLGWRWRSVRLDLLLKKCSVDRKFITMLYKTLYTDILRMHNNTDYLPHKLQ